MRSIRQLDTRLKTLVGNEPSAIARVEEVLKGPGTFNRYGLVVPSKSAREVHELVVPDLITARYRMQEIMLEGKSVIYFPGAFDLVHLGHASYIQEGIAHVLRTTKLTRDDLFVVVLADSDDLIEAAKPAHQYTKNGSHPRPIESEKIFRHVLASTTDVNPRLLDLAHLGVDMVGLIPSPQEAHRLLDDWSFRRWFERFGNFEKTGALLMVDAGDEISAEAKKTLAEYEALTQSLKDGRFDRVLTSFDCVKYGLPDDSGNAYWSLPAWQLLLHRFLGMVHQLPQAGCYRIISQRDNYSAIVKRLMELSNIKTAMVNDTHLVSTTALLETYGWQKLYEEKIATFRKWAHS